MSALFVPQRGAEVIDDMVLGVREHRASVAAARQAAIAETGETSAGRAGARRRMRQRGYYMYQGGRRMLVVSRREGERLVIDSRLEVVVLEVRNGTVKLGIYAPPASTSWSEPSA